MNFVTRDIRRDLNYGPFTYDQAKEILGKRQCKKVARNTDLHWLNSGQIAVRLHQTDVVIHNQDGTASLHTDEWRTCTTKDRINTFSPAKVWTENNIWRVGEAFFQEGIVVNRKGKVQGDYIPWTKVLREKHRLDRAVLRYIREYADQCRTMRGLPHPDNHTCLSCGCEEDIDMRNISASEPLGVSHLLDHIREEEYPAKLLEKAARLATRDMDQCVKWMDYVREVLHHNGQTDLIVRVLSRYFRLRKQPMMDLILDGLKV